MEVWALEGFGVSHILQEMLTYKSDHMPAREGLLVIGDQKKQKTFCEQCGVEFVDSRIRRYQMGYIKLAYPVTHVWYLKRLPSYIANLLDKPLKELESLVYCDV
ncbi:DNA-directed RNA polymerase subunit beta' [Linum perenne]